MVKIYRASDVGFSRYHEGKKVLNFSGDLSERPKEFTEKTLIQMLTETESRWRCALKQIHLDPEAGIYYPRSFAVNYGSMTVDSLPLVRGFNSGEYKSENEVLYEIMPVKKRYTLSPILQEDYFMKKVK